MKYLNNGILKFYYHSLGFLIRYSSKGSVLCDIRYIIYFNYHVKADTSIVVAKLWLLNYSLLFQKITHHSFQKVTAKKRTRKPLKIVLLLKKVQPKGTKKEEEIPI